MAFAKNAGIVNGYGNGKFELNNSVTRREFSKMAWKTLCEDKEKLMNIIKNKIWKTPSVSENKNISPDLVNTIFVQNNWTINNNSQRNNSKNTNKNTKKTNVNTTQPVKTETPNQQCQ